MKKLLFAGFLLLGAYCVSAQNEVKVWSRLVGAANYDFGGGVAVDPFGNVVFGGPTQSSLGGQSAGVFDVYAGKCDASGNVLWLAQRGTSEIEYGWDDLNEGTAGAVASDASGNVYIVGRTQGAMDGNSNIGGYDFFLVKFGPTGNWLWTKQDGTGLNDNARGVTTDASGNVYVSGTVRGDFHGQTRAGAADVFVNKYDLNGNRLWTVLLGSENVDEGWGITCDADGNVIVTGWSDGSIEGLPYLSNGDNILAKYDSNGQRLWLREWGTFNKDTGYAVATDAARNIYLSGYTTGPLYTNAPFGNRDVFLAKFDAGGTNLWGKQFGTGQHDQGWGVACDAADNVFVAGQYNGQVIGDAPPADVFVAKYDPAGSQIWFQQLGTTNSDLAHGVATDTNGNVFVAGWSFGDFDGNSNTGLADIVLVKYAPTNSLPPAPTAIPATDLTISGFTANWYASIPADGYRLDVSTNASFSDYLSGYQDAAVGNVLSQSISGLGPGTTCYYRVRAYNANGSSGNSGTIAATTVIPVCTPATLLNGSFEGATNNGVGANWTTYLRAPNPPIVAWRIETAGVTNDNGLQYQRIATTNSLGGGAGVRQDITGCTIGATYIVSGWMRCNSGRATCKVRVSPSASTDWSTAIDLNPPQFFSGDYWVPFSGSVVATGTSMTLWLDGQTDQIGYFKASDFDAVTVTCQTTPVPLHFESVNVSEQGQVELELSGTVGDPVTIRHSSNLTNWIPLITLTNITGTLQYTDTSATNASQRFYQATTP